LALVGDWVGWVTDDFFLVNKDFRIFM